MGFLRLPYLEKNFSFLIGFVAGSALVFLMLILINTWNKKTEKNSHARRQSSIWTGLGILIFAASLFCLFVFNKRNKSLKNQLSSQHQEIQKQ